MSKTRGKDYEIFGKRIAKLREEKGLSQYVLSNLLGMSQSTYAGYEKGTRKVPLAIINRLSEFYKVSTVHLTEWSAPESKYFPKLGRIAGGVPMFTNNEHEEYVVASSDIKADFCLEVRGDSMINARINDGDIVFIRKQADVNDGEIAAVQIDDEATLKRVYKSNDELRLEAANDRYPTLIYKITDAQNVSILGKAVAFQSNI